MRRRKVWIDGRLDIYQAGGKTGRHEYVYGIDITTGQPNVIVGNTLSASVGDTLRAMIAKNRMRIDTTPSWFGMKFDDTSYGDGDPWTN